MSGLGEPGSLAALTAAVGVLVTYLTRPTPMPMAHQALRVPRGVILWATLAFVVASWATIETLNHLTGHQIELQSSIRTECLQSGGNCKWRVRACPPAEWFLEGPGREDLRCTPEEETRSRRENLLRDLAAFPGLLVYPLAALGGAVAMGAAALGKRAGWRRTYVVQALVFLGVLARFCWLGVFTAVF